MAKVAESCDRNERARKLLEQMLHLLFQTWNSQPGQFTELSSLVDLLTGPLAGSPGRSASAMSVLDALTQAADLAQSVPDVSQVCLSRRSCVDVLQFHMNPDYRTKPDLDSRVSW